MKDENALINVYYKYNNHDIKGDLVCELTEFIDKYIIAEKKPYTWYKTYLYNDIDVFSSDDLYQIAFRLPRSYYGRYTIKET